jgi:hypothetical protein
MRTWILKTMWILIVSAVLCTMPNRSEAVVHYGCFLNGNWVEGTTQTVYAGQQLNFSDHYQTHPVPVVPGSPTSNTLTVSWEIDGHPIKSYVIGADSAEVTYLSAADLSQLSFTCYLLASGPATAICRVTEEAYTGQTWYSTASCSLTILKPVLIPVPTLGQVSYTNNGIFAGIHVGIPSADHGVPGIHISNSDPSNGVNMPAGPFIEGDYCWCQLIHTLDCYEDYIVRSHNQTDPTLDGEFPYAGIHHAAFEDSPQFSVPTLVDPLLSIDMSFTTYLMWNCGISNSIYVPINSTDWKARAEESWGNLSGPGISSDNIQTDITIPPTWNATRT